MMTSSCRGCLAPVSVAPVGGWPLQAAQRCSLVSSLRRTRQNLQHKYTCVSATKNSALLYIKHGVTDPGALEQCSPLSLIHK